MVLRKRDFRETSLIVDFYTREYGKISGLLKGIRADPRKFASTLEPFSHNEIVFYRKRNTSLHLVSQCDVRDNFDGVRQDIEKCGIGSFMMELLAAVMPPEDKNGEVFGFSLSCLQELSKLSQPHKIETIYKIKMLALSGFKPHFDSCVLCGRKISGQSRFSLKNGGLLCPACFTRDPAGRQIFRGTIATILYIEKNGLSESLKLGMNPQIRKELQAILNAFLHFHLDRQLKSQRVLEEVSL
ncbi:MAG: DNA repair protein RecO [Candidatus Omnitrophica bacterium]|nr:DNA repair protein RecO [Candidatus Omnitrophota bacterium]